MRLQFKIVDKIQQAKNESAQNAYKTIIEFRKSALVSCTLRKTKKKTLNTRPPLWSLPTYQNALI